MAKKHVFSLRILRGSHKFKPLLSHRMNEQLNTKKETSKLPASPECCAVCSACGLRVRHLGSGSFSTKLLLFNAVTMLGALTYFRSDWFTRTREGCWFRIFHQQGYSQEISKSNPQDFISPSRRLAAIPG